MDAAGHGRGVEDQRDGSPAGQVGAGDDKRGQGGATGEGAAAQYQYSETAPQRARDRVTDIAIVDRYEGMDLRSASPLMRARRPRRQIRLAMWAIRKSAR